MGCGQSKTSSKSLNLRKLRLDDDQKQKDDNVVDVSNSSPGIVLLTFCTAHQMVAAERLAEDQKVEK